MRRSVIALAFASVTALSLAGCKEAKTTSNHEDDATVSHASYQTVFAHSATETSFDRWDISISPEEEAKLRNEYINNPTHTEYDKIVINAQSEFAYKMYAMQAAKFAEGRSDPKNIYKSPTTVEITLNEHQPETFQAIINGESYAFDTILDTQYALNQNTKEKIFGPDPELQLKLIVLETQY